MSETNERMNIAIAYSANWLEYTLAEIFSIFKHNKSPVKIYLVSDEDGRPDSKIVKKLLDYFGIGYSIEFIDAEKLFDEKMPSKLNISSRFTKYAHYRLLFPLLIPEDKLLHIDADCVINGDLWDLWLTEMDDNYLVGREDMGANHYNLKKPIGLRPFDVYVNAGVLLMNLKKIREDNLPEKWFYEINNNRYQAGDQCVLNKTCKNKILPLDNEYNVSVSTGLNILKDDIKIMHYAGEKPFNSNKVTFPQFYFRNIKEYRKLIDGDASG